LKVFYIDDKRAEEALAIGKKAELIALEQAVREVLKS
jgi:hypothetical protein